LREADEQVELFNFIRDPSWRWTLGNPPVLTGIVLLRSTRQRLLSQLQSRRFLFQGRFLGSLSVVAYNCLVATYLWSLAILSIVLVGQILAIDGLYAKMPLVDIPLHILGGIGIGLFIAAMIGSGALKFKSKKRGIIAGVILAGIAWESIEVYYNITGYVPGTKMYYLDTAKDLIDDIIGGLAAIWFTRNRT
jgi:hypothetical protein